jgi:hypothetical protein
LISEDAETGKSRKLAPVRIREEKYRIFYRSQKSELAWQFEKQVSGLNPGSLVRGMNPDPALDQDTSIIMQK